MSDVAEFAVSNSLGSFSSFCNADIKPSGLRVSSTAVLSAKYSLFLERASCIKVPKIGDNIKNEYYQIITAMSEGTVAALNFAASLNEK